jgi:rhamnose utilization protein RhaD (predicted bifunctional aldolase and dehydrogenase)
MAPNYRGELSALSELSARLGRQPELVQASTGNTSIKIGDTLWIKASGKWLCHAAEEEIFVPVDYPGADPDRSCDGPQSRVQGSGLKPSIETAMHLVIPHRVVIHAHSISAIAWAVQRNGAALLRKRLKGIRWCWIRYTPSGVPLARAIGASLPSSPDLFLLANHGLVVGGDSCAAAEARLKDVEARLALTPRGVPPPDVEILESLAESTNFRLPDNEVVHSLATDRDSTEIVCRGILYPCQALFLGRLPCMVSRGQNIRQVIRQYQDHNGGVRPPALLIRNHGVLVAKDLNPSEWEMLIGLSHVTRRLSADAKIAYLSDRRIQKLLEGEVYADARPHGKYPSRSSRARVRAASYSRQTA